MKIRFATDILRRLGEELNPSLDKGILELVKNSYDADSSSCNIELINIDQPGGTVVITDSGDGMSSEEIENGWLVLGYSTKENIVRTQKGRIPAGSKGLGRLAALRMGEQVMLSTRPKKENGIEYNLLIDWSDFNDAKLIDDVVLELEKAKINSKWSSGTEIRIENLRIKIGRRDIERLARELILLSGPFDDEKTGFKPILRSPEYQDLEELVKHKYFSEADYHLIAETDGEGKYNAQVLDGRGGIIFSLEEGASSKSSFKDSYSCPKLRFELWNFVLNKSNYQSHKVPESHIRKWLAHFGGIHVYQNNLRVTPYGDPGSDWLDMNLSRVRSPEERPSTNNSVGRVVFDDERKMLVQKTDRSGFIETDYFREIKDFCKDALDWMSGRRLEEAEKRRELEKKETERKAKETWDDLDSEVSKLPKNSQTPVQAAVNKTKKEVKKQFQQMESEIQLYRTLSTAGITAATFAHESAGNPIKVIQQATSTIKRRAKEYAKESYMDKLEAPINNLENAIKSLAVLGNATLDLLNHEKRRAVSVNIHETINDILRTFKPFLDTRKITPVSKFYPDGAPYLRTSKAAIESIITNLVNNSVVAFDNSSSNKERIIQITTDVCNNQVIIIFSDSGPGIESISCREIWLPGKTTRPNGTGLGLTIVKDTVKDLGGEVGVREHGDLGGAEFTISFPILGVE